MTFLIFLARRFRHRDASALRRGARAAGMIWVPINVPLVYALIPLLVLARLLRAFRLDCFLVISDAFPGDPWLAKLFGTRCARMMWNYASEFPNHRISVPARRLLFFDAGNSNFGRFVFAPQPTIRAAPGRTLDIPVSYTGDVTLSFALSRDHAWWLPRLSELYEVHGVSMLRVAEFGALLRAAAPSAEERQSAYLLARNYLRLRLVTAAKRALGRDFVVFGASWSKFDIEAQPANGSPAFRRRLFERSRVNLDCGSEAGDSALYPRSAEIITFGGGILQAWCPDSARLFAERVNEFSFGTQDELVELLRERLEEPMDVRVAREGWLHGHLERTGLMMSNSLQQLIGSSRLAA